VSHKHPLSGSIPLTGTISHNSRRTNVGHNEEKSRQLGMPAGTAQGKLRKMVLFHLLKKHNENFCFQCGTKIETVEELSIEHKKPWLHESVDLFWDMDNIAFSHLSCNVKARDWNHISIVEHGTTSKYRYGCRCDSCRCANTNEMAIRRKTQKVI